MNSACYAPVSGWSEVVYAPPKGATQRQMREGGVNDLLSTYAMYI